MAEWSALKRWQAHLAGHYVGGDGRPLELTYTGDPEPGTGKIHIFCSPQPWAEGVGWFDRKHVPDFLLRPMWWSATWTAEGRRELKHCPVTHKRGVYEWAARQPAAETVELIEHTSEEVPIELPPPVNRTPDPGCGILEITFDKGKPHWQGAWYDEYTGLAVMSSDDLREVVKWAQAQPAERKVFYDVGRSGPVELDKFVANPDRYLHEAF